VQKQFEYIDSPVHLKKLSVESLTSFADYLRQYLIEQIAEQGGHFAANLGTVELTVALHYVFNSPIDKMVWDVGHQAYAHKVITERKNNFSTLRKKEGMSGFPKMSESIHDAFGTGHSSTSISVILGYAEAAKLQKMHRQHIAIIGDGALSAGQAFEALNNAALSQTNITIIINDNHIGIDPSQGALGEYLEQLEFKKDNFFTDLGFQYFGPLDGHNITELIPVFEQCKNIASPKIIHIKTTKGKGYKPAEEEQTKWHSTSQFDKLSGKSLSTNDGLPKYQDIFGKALLELAKQNEKIVAITPAMISGSSLHFMQKEFPSRVFDVGIAEQHAVTFSAGLAASGLRPFCCIYSTFLQRGYDQLIHDVALQNLPIIFAIDRAGLVGEDGPTHHGVFDLSFLQAIPNLVITSPRNAQELLNAMKTAETHSSSPFVIRYPRGKALSKLEKFIFEQQEIGKAECLTQGTQCCIISHGTLANEVMKAMDKLVSQYSIAHYDFKYLKPLDLNCLQQIFKKFDKIIVIEEGQQIGGLGSTICTLAFQEKYKGNIECLAIEDKFIEHGSPAELLQITELNSTAIISKMNKMFE